MTSPPPAAPAGPAPAEVAPEAPRPHPPLGPVRRTIREVGLALITAGVVVLLFVLYQLVGTNFTEEHSQSSLARQFNSTMAQTRAAPAPAAPSGPPAPVLPSVPPGGAIDHLVIPRINLDKFVVEGTSDDDLRRGPGHYPGTPYPGQPGNSAIAGHRTTYGAPFFDLNQMVVGDPIYITDLTGHTWVYKVSGPPQVVSPDDVSVLDPTPFGQLTLTTCNPRFSATSRLVVFARLQGTATPPPVSPPVKPAAAAVLAGADNSLGSGRSGAELPAVGYGGLALALWIATRIGVALTRRWLRLAVLVVGIGVCLVPLWFCFEDLVLLLPPNF